MSLEPFEQLKNFLEKSKDILIVIPENPSGDAVGSAWSLYFFLEKKGLIPTIAFSNNLSPKFAFLPKPEKILNEITGARDFVLSFETSRNKIVNIKTEEKDNKFNIYLTPEKGSIDPRDFSFILAKFKYDLVIAIDTPDLEKLGKIHEKNTDLFFEVPVANIDYRSNNENFGQINLVDIMSSSCSEIILNFIEKTEPLLLDKKIADCLLTGIISATDSFQKKNTTPKALLSAASLMDKGANQQEIVRWLYKTHPLHILKLWGRAMAKLKWDESLKLVWAELTLDDFIQSRSNPIDVNLILEKLQENYSDGKIFMVVYSDTADSCVVKLKISEAETAIKLKPVFNGTLKRDILEFSFPAKDISQAGEIITKSIKDSVGLA